MIKPFWKALFGLWSEEQLTENQIFDVDVIFYTVTYVFSSKKICLRPTERIHIFFTFTWNMKAVGAIIFHRVFPHTKLNFQEIFVFYR